MLDASAVVEWLLHTAAGVEIAHRVLFSGESLHSPHLLEVEVAQVLRRGVLARAISAERARQALDDLAQLRLQRYPHFPLLPRVWELRGNFTAYDALYVALAEGLGATLLTRDRKLASAPGHRVRVEVI